MTRTLAGALLALLLAAAGPASAELRVFVTNEKSDDVTVIAASTGDVLKTIPVGKRPRGARLPSPPKKIKGCGSTIFCPPTSLKTFLRGDFMNWSTRFNTGW